MPTITGAPVGSTVVSGTLAEDPITISVEVTGAPGLTPRRVDTLISASSYTFNSDLYDAARITDQATDLIVAAPTGTPAPLQQMLLRIRDNGTAQSLSWNSVFRVIGGHLPTSTTVGKYLYVGAMWNEDDSLWDVLAIGQEA